MFGEERQKSRYVAMLPSRLTIVAMLLLANSTAALADDWRAAKLRGPVFQYVDGQWLKLERNMVVPDDRPIQTLGDGHVVFTRGRETIDVGPATQIRIVDRGTAARPATTVNQYFGTVSIEAQVEDVQHFTVQTSYLAAIVKGTKFTVTTSKVGTGVSVERGHVAVEDRNNNTHVLLGVGQSASVDIRDADPGIVVAGKGDLPAVVALSAPLSMSPASEGGSRAKGGANGHGSTGVQAKGAGPSNGQSDALNGGKGNSFHGPADGAGPDRHGNTASSDNGGQGNVRGSDNGGQGNASGSDNGGQGNAGKCGGKGNSAC